ncbi:MAG: trypsin-like peptidase domain-containing protein [Clostridia bacterium]|nr:trypsin-like peptidase domain-containing protein [Clostridia bacterium]
MEEFNNYNENETNEKVEPLEESQPIEETSAPTEEPLDTNEPLNEDFGVEDNFDSEPELFSNPIQYSPVKPYGDYKPMSKGLKIFALILALLIALSGVGLGGYFVGKNSTVTGNTKRAEVNLASKPTKTDEYTEAQIYEMINKSIVGIYIYNSDGKLSQASGVVYSKDGYIVTNDHIYSEIPAAKFKIYTSDGKEYDAKYVAGDTISDLAVLKVDNAKLSPATFGNSNELFHGEHVVAIGRPNDATDDSSITSGIVSAVHRRVQTTSSYSANLIQTDSAINPGSSGGALANMYGQVIGITSSKLAGVEYDAIGYAIPTVTVKRIVEELIRDGKVTSRAKLGISYQAIDSVAAEINNFDHVGLYVAEVSEDSALYGKVKASDVITHVNGIEIINDTIILDVIEESRAGDTITVTVVTQNNKTNDYSVVLSPNVGESSYTTESIKSEDNNGSSGGGTFDFPFGE